jgi:prophage DNA circulation protein
MAISPWRMRLQPASYNGVQFHVDVGARASGRRIALHEFPKKDKPYSEDMGRKARRFTIAAYVIGPDFEDQRDALIEQFEAEGNGRLVLPTSTDEKLVVVDGYSVTERRERGGYAEFAINFVEAGEDISNVNMVDTQSAVTGAVDKAVAGPTVLGTANTFMNSPDITALK